MLYIRCSKPLHALVRCLYTYLYLSYTCMYHRLLSTPPPPLYKNNRFLDPGAKGGGIPFRGSGVIGPKVRGGSTPPARGGPEMRRGTLFDLNPPIGKGVSASNFRRAPRAEMNVNPNGSPIKI